METIGEHLKRVRKTCGYSLEDAAHVTRINLHYLEAIENDDFSKLPGETFLQGFLRSYARFLGIDEQVIIHKLKETKAAETLHADTHEKAEEEEQQQTPAAKNLRIILPLGAGAVAVLTIIMLLSGGRETSTVYSSKESKEIEQAEEINIEPEPAGVKDEQVLQPAVENKEPVQLKISAREETWIQASIDEADEKDVLLQTGDVILWKGDEKIIMTVGNAGGVDLEINGAMQEPIGKSGEVVRNMIITAAGMVKGQTTGNTGP